MYRAVWQRRVFIQSFKTSAELKDRRVVVTGLGVISPVGCTVHKAWSTILGGGCGIVQLEDERYNNLPCQVAGLIQEGKDAQKFDLTSHFSKSELRSMAPATAYAIIAAQEALQDARWFPEEEKLKQMTGVAVGMGMIDLVDVCETAEALKKGYNRVSPFFVPRILPNMAAGQISIKYGFRGPNHTVSTACATGAHAVGDAFRFVQRGDADVMICGGAEACICPLSIAGFCRLRALSTSYNKTPEKASRPFDKGRDGFVMGEGSAMLVLEELHHALSRGANIYAEILGYGLSGDAYHLTAPKEDGTGAILAMSRALKDAKLHPHDIGYINAHATSTPVGDAIESTAIKTLFGTHCNKLAVSSTKGAHGHLLGAAGNLEAVFTVMACHTAWLPPTINLDNPEESMNLNYVPNKKQEWFGGIKRFALKNAFGFGGTNASICIAEYREK
ncbi:3-oxoacyl-[acyl-carrier-protein] synthase, mitochondrial isoform X2 [Zootermopsis nevadensis]|uniref:3-oxoacyl-[acyl-carrier-protein] synthase, mitochondrial isoform X2 n=1 Tax=Zootermopsis nevadensis TaxID=136037 RepID=UPI000B8E4D7F|nr:3-oxoacyl-[acyl-carrier-protein] synthase, mitochondrial isoform X2 [Zootermopsis nevadensis]